MVWLDPRIHQSMVLSDWKRKKIGHSVSSLAKYCKPIVVDHHRVLLTVRYHFALHPYR